MSPQEVFNFNTGAAPENRQPVDNAEHNQPGEVKNDMFNFNTKVETRDQKQNADFLAQVAEWEKQGNARENILRLRQAGFTADQNAADGEERHVKLSAAFTNPETDPSKPDRNTFSVNFRGNGLAEKYVGLGDILPPNAERVKVYGIDGQIVTGGAVRKINPATGRIGYYDESSGAYISVHSGFRFSIVSSRTSPAKDSPAGDPVLQRRKLAEDVTVFRDPAKTPADFFAPDDSQKGVAPPKPETIPEQFNFNLIPGEPDPATKTPSVPEPEQPAKSFKDYNPVALKKVPPGISGKAKEILRRGNPIGTVTVFEQDGKTYVARDEVHRHAPTDNVPPALKQNHHGVTVYEAQNV